MSAHVDEFPNSRTTIAAARVDGTGAQARSPLKWVGRKADESKWPNLSRKAPANGGARCFSVGFQVSC